MTTMPVSVCVVSYNSAATILETLDSIKNQTIGAKNIELIIADDASPDNTVTLVEQWLEEHKSLFLQVSFVKHNINLGVTRNINSAWKMASYVWIKSIAGDDILMPDCLQSNIEFVEKNGITSVVFSQMQSFTVSDNNIIKNLSVYPSILQQEILSSERDIQYDYLTKACGFGCAPSSFLNRNLLSRVGYADERFTMIEDFPLWMKILEENEKLYFLKKITVKYRVGNSISQSKHAMFNINHVIQCLNADIILTSAKVTWVINLRKFIYYMVVIFIFLFFQAKDNILTKAMYRIALLIKPFWLRDKLKK